MGRRDGGECTTADILQSYYEASRARHIPRDVVDMVFILATPSATTSQGPSHSTLPVCTLRRVSSGHDSHAPKPRPDLGGSAKRSYDRRIREKGGWMAQWCNPDCVRSLLVFKWAWSADRVTTVASERNPMTTWGWLGRTLDGKLLGRFMTTCRERSRSCT